MRPRLIFRTSGHTDTRSLRWAWSMLECPRLCGHCLAYLSKLVAPQSFYKSALMGSKAISLVEHGRWSGIVSLKSMPGLPWTVWEGCGKGEKVITMPNPIVVGA